MRKKQGAGGGGKADLLVCEAGVQFAGEDGLLEGCAEGYTQCSAEGAEEVGDGGGFGDLLLGDC